MGPDTSRDANAGRITSQPYRPGFRLAAREQVRELWAFAANHQTIAFGHDPGPRAFLQSRLFHYRPAQPNPETVAPSPHRGLHAGLPSPYAAAASIIRDAFSPIMIDGALVLPEVSVGMIEASATRSPSIPWTRSSLSTTAIGSAPILQVPTGW